MPVSKNRLITMYGTRTFSIASLPGSAVYDWAKSHGYALGIVALLGAASGTLKFLYDLRKARLQNAKLRLEVAKLEREKKVTELIASFRALHRKLEERHPGALFRKPRMVEGVTQQLLDEAWRRYMKEDHPDLPSDFLDS